MKLRTVLPVAAIAGVAALGGGAVGALAQEGEGDRSAPSQQRGGQHSMKDRADMRRMDRHHGEMTRQMREIDPEMVDMMKRHHAEMMRRGGMGDMDRG